MGGKVYGNACRRWESWIRRERGFSVERYEWQTGESANSGGKMESEKKRYRGEEGKGGMV